jgi:MYXO-CTERM domain-containing protein
MRSTRVTTYLAGAALAVAIPSVTMAQDAANTTDPYATTAAPVEDDDDFPWGLLGLLGLAGLLGLKRRDDTVHVDNRTRPQP